MTPEEYEELLAEHDPSVEDETREETDRMAEEAIQGDQDPNEDLIGFEFMTEDGGMVTVTGSPEWSSNYVTVEAVANEGQPHEKRFISVRPAGLVRQAKLRLAPSDDRDDAQDQDDEHEPEGEADPERRQDPEPTPVDYVGQLEDDEGDREQTAEADAARTVTA